ncbi:MAG: cation:proton antiporter [Nitratireductor sp.]
MEYGFLSFAVWASLAMLTLSFFLTIFRVIKGPTLPDRIVALDMLVGIAIGYIAVIGVKTGYYLYVDVAIALALVGFLATVAFARFILSRGITREDAATIKQEGDQ